jgi:hypothetical protein
MSLRDCSLDIIYYTEGARGELGGGALKKLTVEEGHLKMSNRKRVDCENSKL